MKSWSWPCCNAEDEDSCYVHWTSNFFTINSIREKSVVVRKRSTLGLHSSNCTFNKKYSNYWYKLLFIPSVDPICVYVGGRCILLFVPFYRFVWMSGFLLKYIFINLFISLFYQLIYNDNGNLKWHFHEVALHPLFPDRIRI